MKYDFRGNLGDNIDEGIVINAKTMMAIKDHYILGACVDWSKERIVRLENAYREFKKVHDRSFNYAGEYIGDYKSFEEEAEVMKEFADSFYKLMKELGRIFDGE